MRVNEADTLFKGDVICCPRCESKIMRAIRDIPRGSKLLSQDFEPVGKMPALANGDPLVCSSCGGEVFRGGRFIEIERDAQSYCANRTKKDGVVALGDDHLDTLKKP